MQFLYAILSKQLNNFKSEDSKWLSRKHFVLAEVKVLIDFFSQSLVSGFGSYFFVSHKFIKRRCKKVSASLEAKKLLVEEIKDKIQRAKSLTFVDYRGLTVEEDTKMRAAFRNAGADYKVYKNRLLLRALEECGITGLESVLEGTSAVAFGFEDEVAPNKIIVDTIKDTQKMQIKGGVLNGQVVDVAMVEKLASIPSKEVLLAKLLFLLQSPVRGLAVALNAIAEKNN